MSTAKELLRQGKTREMWQKYCGFVDLSIEEFMAIQKRLLMEQLELLRNCELGLKVMRGARPITVEEFRDKVPLTTYDDYAPYLLEKREDVLPEKPLFWQRTSGRSGEYRFKWVPVTERLYRELGIYIVAWGIFCSCLKKGDISFRGRDKLLYGWAPPPYPTGAIARVIENELEIDTLPPMKKAERMAFRKRTSQGLSLALDEGLDFVFGLSSVLVALGEQVSEGIEKGFNIPSLLSHPRALPRLVRGLIKSKLEGRRLLPKDLWSVKGIGCIGTDSSVLREKIAHYWGKPPLEVYGAAEVGIFAIQTWDYKDLIFVPSLCFLEFIPEEEYLKLRRNQTHRPRTILLDEVEAGKRYELIFTSLQGGPFVRYRIGDMIKVVAVRNEHLNINLPQIAVDSRIDGIIDIGGFPRLTESAISRAIEESGLACQGWTARKEVRGEPLIHIYIELKDQQVSAEEARLAIHRSLKEIDHDYAALEDMLGFKPLRVTLLPEGAFQRYMAEQQAKGKEPADPEVPRLNAPDEVIERLIGTTLG